MFPRSHSSSPFWGSTGATILAVPTNPFDNEISTTDTLHIMSALANRDAGSPLIQSLAHELLIGCSTAEQFFQSLWYWIKNRIEFKQHEDIIPSVLGVDGIDKQLLISPSTLLALPLPEGDCAVFSTLVASVLVAGGFAPLYKVISADSNEPERWSHVYVIVPTASGYYSMDVSHGKYPGWEYQNRYREMTWVV